MVIHKLIHHNILCGSALLSVAELDCHLVVLAFIVVSPSCAVMLYCKMVGGHQPSNIRGLMVMVRFRRSVEKR